MDHIGPEKLAVLSEDESEQIVELINHIQPASPWSMKHLRWQFFETPAGRARLYGIRDSKNKLVAFYAAVAQRVRLGNRLVPARMIQDVMTHPDYRGRGFLHHLAERCRQDIVDSDEVGYTFPNEKSEKSFRRIGWTELCSVPWRQKSLHPALTSKPKLEVTQISGGFDDVASSIWSSSDLAVGVNRDAAYLNWRYGKPATTYFKFLVNSHEGLIVLKLYQDGGQSTLHLCELITRNDASENVGEMLKFCQRFGTQNGAGIFTAWLSESHPYSHAFNQFGLEPVSRGSRYVFVHPGQGSAGEVANPKLWHLSQGDSDIY